jgi:hypothetical protein
VEDSWRQAPEEDREQDKSLRRHSVWGRHQDHPDGTKMNGRNKKAGQERDKIPDKEKRG